MLGSHNILHSFEKGMPPYTLHSYAAINKPPPPLSHISISFIMHHISHLSGLACASHSSLITHHTSQVGSDAETLLSAWPPSGAGIPGTTTSSSSSSTIGSTASSSTGTSLLSVEGTFGAILDHLAREGLSSNQVAALR